MSTRTTHSSIPEKFKYHTATADKMHLESPPISNGTNTNGTKHQDVKPKAKTISSLSYPSQSLQFLRKVREPCVEAHDEFTPSNPPQAKLKLKIIIVGAGLGGLATSIALARRGHQVTVMEQAHQLGEVGAGIQIPSNSSLLLERWGLSNFLSGKVVEPQGMTFRRWENGNAIGYTKLVPDFRESFGASYYVVHRADFHVALHQRALQLGVDVKVNCKVVDYDLKAPAVTLANADSLSADLVIAADGVKSVARRLVLGGIDHQPVHTGFAAYRATVDVQKMKADPDISWLLEKPSLNIWYPKPASGLRGHKLISGKGLEKTVML
ncbi:FAD-dependent monooxygenase OpS4 [Lachnellula arida]|uniref:FAD-dependent monooxygenase OpS4 n=1 Tax=Lachnellula arida TaxID=1316785 RepID=A0A8T9B8B0_9HELO|nr:FAD-dependent monooxygenase OpS4 [Lachnellula arida]